MTKREKILDNLCDSLEIEIMRLQNHVEDEDRELAEMVLTSSRLSRKKTIEAAPSEEDVLMAEMAIHRQKEQTDATKKR